MKSAKTHAPSAPVQDLDKGPGAELRPIISNAVRNRHPQIAAKLTTHLAETYFDGKLEREITAAMLYNWSSLTKARVRFPADLVALFCEITGDDSLQRALLSPRLLRTLELGEFVLRLLEDHLLELRKKAPR